MDIHKNARTCIYSRQQIAQRMMAGEQAKKVAAEFGISERSAYKWDPGGQNGLLFAGRQF